MYLVDASGDGSTVFVILVLLPTDFLRSGLLSVQHIIAHFLRFLFLFSFILLLIGLLPILRVPLVEVFIICRFL